MKIVVSLTMFAAVALSALALWNTQTIKQRSADEVAGLVDQIRELDEQIQAIGSFQGLVGELVKTNPDKKSAESDKYSKVSVLEDRLKVQTTANDRQRQDVDFLKSQRLHHKQLIDQINTDLVKIKRENRETSQELQQLNKSPGSNVDIINIKRRVDDLYRRLDRGR